MTRWRMAAQVNKWAPPRKSGGIRSVSTKFSLSMEMSRLRRDETVKPLSRDQILRRERGHGNLHFFCSATSRTGNLTRLILTFAIYDGHTFTSHFPNGQGYYVLIRSAYVRYCLHFSTMVCVVARNHVEGKTSTKPTTVY